MTYFAQMAKDGVLPVLICSNPTENESVWIAMPNGLSMAECATLMMEDGKWSHRPKVTAPALQRTKEGLEVSFDGLPDGAICDVYDRDLNWVLDDVAAIDGRIAFVLVDPGTYQVDVSVPSPWIGLTQNLEVA